MHYFSFYWWYFLVLKRKQKNRLCSLKNNLSGTNCITEMFPRYLLFHCLWVNIQTHLHGLWVHMTKFHGLRVYGPRSMGPCHCDLVPLCVPDPVPCLWVHITQFHDLWVHMTQFHGLGSTWPTMYCKGITVLPVKESPSQIIRFLAICWKVFA